MGQFAYFGIQLFLLDGLLVSSCIIGRYTAGGGFMATLMITSWKSRFIKCGLCWSLLCLNYVCHIPCLRVSCFGQPSLVVTISRGAHKYGPGLLSCGFTLLEKTYFKSVVKSILRRFWIIVNASVVKDKIDFTTVFVTVFISGAFYNGFQNHLYICMLSCLLWRLIRNNRLSMSCISMTVIAIIDLKSDYFLWDTKTVIHNRLSMCWIFTTVY